VDSDDDELLGEGSGDEGGGGNDDDGLFVPGRLTRVMSLQYEKPDTARHLEEEVADLAHLDSAFEHLAQRFAHRLSVRVLEELGEELEEDIDADLECADLVASDARGAARDGGSSDDHADARASSTGADSAAGSSGGPFRTSLRRQPSDPSLSRLRRASFTRSLSEAAGLGHHDHLDAAAHDPGLDGSLKSTAAGEKRGQARAASMARTLMPKKGGNWRHHGLTALIRHHVDHGTLVLYCVPRVRHLHEDSQHDHEVRTSSTQHDGHTR